MQVRKKENITMLIGGISIGILSAVLLHLGNPGNMGLCIACFWRDIAGALGLSQGPAYLRPEILGIVLGAFIMSIIGKDFKSRGGSSPLIRFTLGAFMTIGALIFLGCPFRMILRLANGDLNALAALAGFIVGIFIGIYFLKRGFSLGRNYKQVKIAAYIVPAFAIMLLIFAFVGPDFIIRSAEGPGSMSAPILISLLAGLAVGAVLQRTRLCSAAAFRDVIMIKNAHYLYGIIGIFVGALVFNLILGNGFHLSFQDQPVAHSNHLFNFIGMALVGLIAVLIGGCPIRQTVLASEGDSDAGVTVMGIIFGAAMAHNLSMAGSGKGVPANGKIGVIIIFVITLIIAFAASRRD